MQIAVLTAFIVARDVCPTPSGYLHYACDILSIASGKEEDGGSEITTIICNYKRGRDLLQFLIMNMGNLQDKTWAIYKTKHGQSTRQNMDNLQDKTRRHQWPTTYIMYM